MDDEVSRNSINPGDRASYVTSNETTPLQRDKVQNEGLRYIITTFGVVTVIITIALGVTISKGTKEVSFNSDVVSDRLVCSNIGREIFKTGGNAVDAAVAVTICLGVVLPHLTGIGGNGLILVYDQRLVKPLLCLDSWTPGNTAFPKLLLALFMAHEKHGKKSWEEVIDPSIKLAREGFTAAESLIQAKSHLSPTASANLVSFLSSIQPRTNLTSPRLADTLTTIQKEGPDAFYKGKLSPDLKEFFGAKLAGDLHLDDSPCIESVLEGYHLISSGKGSGGQFLHTAISQANITHNSSISHLIDYFQGKEEISWPFPAGVVVGASDDQDIYVSIVSGLGPVLGSQTLSANGYIFGSGLVLPNSPFIGSIGAAFVATEISSRCKKRLITDAPPMLFYLMKSAERGDLRSMSAFLAERKDSGAVDGFDRSGETPLIKAVKRGDSWAVKKLLASGAGVDLGAHGTGRAPLAYACSLGHRDVAALLLQAGADIHLPDCNKCAALHYAADSNQLEMVKLCIEFGANVNIQDAVGWTPLMRAVIFNSNKEVVSELIANGADLKIKDRHEKTVLELAKINNDHAILELLESTLIKLEESIECEPEIETKLDGDATEEPIEQVCSEYITTAEIEAEGIQDQELDEKLEVCNN